MNRLPAEQALKSQFPSARASPQADAPSTFEHRKGIISMGKYQFAIAEWCVPVAGPAICRLAAEAGLDGVELNLGAFAHNLPLTDAHVRRYYLDAQQKYGVAFAGVAVNTLDQSYAFPPENAQRAEERRFILKAAVDTAAALKIPVVQVPHFWQNAIKNRDERKLAAAFFQAACEAAEAHGIVVSCENPMSVEENLELIELVDRPNFALYFDNENPVYFSNANSAEMLRALGKHVCQLHVKDGTDAQLSCRLLGQGNARFYECVDVLREIGYTGWIVSENNYDMPPLTTFDDDRFERLVEDVAIMRRAFADPD